MQITFQYFDDCPNWRTAHQRLLAAIADRDDVELLMQRAETSEDAETVNFRGSPTVLVNGLDPFAGSDTPPAGALACRVYPTGDGSPTVEQLRIAVAAAPRATQ